MKYPPMFNKSLEVVSIDNLFSRKEVSSILTLSEKIQFERGQTQNINYQSNRTSNIKWLPFSEEFDWVYDRIFEKIHGVNSFVWKFEIGDVNPEPLQFSEYQFSERGKIDWHIDLGNGQTCFRKLSACIQLSDPTEYEGGELVITRGKGEDVVANKQIGSMVLFPSYMLHKVFPITKGVRKSLVLWATGKHFK